MVKFRIGTCSWKYGEWKGLVYSADKGINFLREYSRMYDTVEIDQWFWSLHAADKISLPDPLVVQEYASSVPEDFVFTVKVPNSVTLTHLYGKSKAAPLVGNDHFLSTDLFLRFIDSLDPIRGRIASLMLQFEYLNREKMPQRKVFLDRLDVFLAACPADIPIGIETRNPNYLGSDYFSLLGSRGAHHVYLQGYYMPPVTQVYREHAFAGSPAVIRLHGPDRKGMEEKSGGKWNRLVERREGELREIGAMVTGLLVHGVEVIVNVNNHYEGSAPLTIERFMNVLRQLAQEAGVSLPPRGGNIEA